MFKTPLKQFTKEDNVNTLLAAAGFNLKKALAIKS